MAATPGGKKLVVIEDDPETREIELFVLAAEGYEVVGVADGEGAAATIKQESPALVVLDLLLPGKDGLAVLAEMAEDAGTASTPVVVISGHVNDRGARDRLRRVPQVKQVLEKPFDITKLLDTIALELGRAPR